MKCLDCWTVNKQKCTVVRAVPVCIQCEWVGWWRVWCCRQGIHPITSKSFPPFSLFTCSCHLTASHPSLVATLVLPFLIMLLLTRTSSLELMRLRLPLGVSNKHGGSSLWDSFLRLLWSVLLKCMVLSHPEVAICLKTKSFHSVISKTILWCSVTHFLPFTNACFSNISWFSYFGI